DAYVTPPHPVDALPHIRSVPATAPVPTAAHVLATLPIAPRSTTPPPPPPSPGAPAFINYPAPDNIPPVLGSSSAGQHSAGEPSIGVNWNTGKAFIEAGNHTLRVTFNDASKPASAAWGAKR